MSPIVLILNGLLGALLVAALVLGLRLDRRLRHLRDTQAGFIKAVADLDQAAIRTHAGLQQWRDTADEARELLHDRIEKAKVQSAKLEALLARPLPEAPPAAEPQRPPLRAIEPTPAPAAPVALDEAEARAAALAETVLTLAAAREVPREPARPVRLQPRQPTRTRAFVDDDLFETEPSGALPLQRDLASALGRRS